MIAEILKKYPFIVLDGAFSTELEKQGFAINDELWSAIALYKNPELVEAVHLSYYEAGADIVTSASYQATVDGFEKKGFSKEEAASLIQSSIALVQDARDEYLSSHEEENRPAPLTAASVGPYGAYLADGSEYRGDYGKTREELADFHEKESTFWRKQAPMSLPVKRFPASSKRWQKPTSFLKSRAQKHGFPSPARTDSTPAGATSSPTAPKR